MNVSLDSENRNSLVVFKTSYHESDARIQLGSAIQSELRFVSEETPLIILCIGTDRSTGDSLGPLVGTRLSHLNRLDVGLYGTLSHPVHAMNLEDTIASIHQAWRNPCIIAIDACLGQHGNIGQIHLGRGPLRPGAGVNKKLPPVGDLHLNGIVNVGGFMEYLVLQNTRLSVVMDMADTIADSLRIAIEHRNSNNARLPLHSRQSNRFSFFR